MTELKKNFPDGLDYDIVYDPTIFVRDSIKAVVHTLLEAIVLVVIVVILFLQTWRASIIPLAAVPVSLVGTFAVMHALGFSINALSLFGLVLAIGIVVDDAIVVVENVERNIALGLSPLEATRNPTATRVLLFFSRREIPLLSRFVRVLFNSDIQSRLPPDVQLPHPYGIIVHPQAVIGRRVTLMQQVTIGGRDHRENIAPLIGDDVYIGAGARVLGDVRIGQGVVIGANAVVTRDIPPGVTVVGANRIVATPRAAHAGESDASVTQFPVGMQRGPRIGRSP